MQSLNQCIRFRILIMMYIRATKEIVNMPGKDQYLLHRQAWINHPRRRPMSNPALPTPPKRNRVNAYFLERNKPATRKPVSDKRQASQAVEFMYVDGFNLLCGIRKRTAFDNDRLSLRYPGGQ